MTGALSDRAIADQYRSIPGKRPRPPATRQVIAKADASLIPEPR